MNEPFRSAVVTKRRPDGTTEVFAVDGRTGKEIHTGLAGATDAEAQKKASEVAEIFKRAGHQVSGRSA